MQITILHIHGQTEDLYYVCKDQEIAEKELYNYVSENWYTTGQERIDDQSEMIDLYFEDNLDEEWYVMTTETLIED